MMKAKSFRTTKEWNLEENEETQNYRFYRKRQSFSVCILFVCAMHSKNMVDLKAFKGFKERSSTLLSGPVKFETWSTKNRA